MIDLFGTGSVERTDRANNLIPGVLIGIVTNNADPEKLGRVKLKLPMRDDTFETGWARVATFMAGKGYGGLFIPDVNDEVLVAFHRGEISEPYVVGCLWNKKNTAIPKDAKNEVRKIITKSKHEIEFNDSAAGGKITLKTAKGSTISLEDKTNLITIKDKTSKNMISIKGASNMIELKSNLTTIQISATGDVKIKSTKAITIDSTQITLNAKAKMDIKAGASLNLSSNGLVNIKGTIIKMN